MWLAGLGGGTKPDARIPSSALTFLGPCSSVYFTNSNSPGHQVLVKNGSSGL